MPGKRAGAQRAKSRPITREEHERMLAAVPLVVGPRAVDSWRFFLDGLWASGLRLAEAVALAWDHQPGGVSVRLAGRESVVVFDAAAQKAGRVELCPMAPEFVELVEPHQRVRGPVFVLLRDDGNPMARDPHKVSKVVRTIGRVARVVTDPARGRTAGAHDYRRAFGARWAGRLAPADLCRLMRHQSIATTLTYYAGADTAAVSGRLWAHHAAESNTFGNSRGSAEARSR